MAITAEQLSELNDILTDISGEEGKLSDWERGFVSDQLTRVEKYGQSIFLSPKQWAVLRRIHASVAGDPNVRDEAPEPDQTVERRVIRRSRQTPDDDEIPF